MWVKERRSQDSAVLTDTMNRILFFSYFSTAWVCRRERNAWCLPIKLWAKVTAATGIELMPVDTMITAIPSLSKPTAINSLFEMPDSFHHETSAAKT